MPCFETRLEVPHVREEELQDSAKTSPPQVDGECDLLQRRIASPLANAVDRALDLWEDHDRAHDRHTAGASPCAVLYPRNFFQGATQCRAPTAMTQAPSRKFASNIIGRHVT